ADKTIVVVDGFTLAANSHLGSHHAKLDSYLSDPNGSSLQLYSAKFEKTEQLSLLCAAMERMEYQKKQGRINSALTELIKKLAGRKLPYTEKDLVWNLRCAAIILAPKDPKKVQYEELDSPIPGVVPALLDQTEMLIREKPDRKSTRLNSSHVAISYAVFCLKKKNEKREFVSLISS